MKRRVKTTRKKLSRVCGLSSKMVAVVEGVQGGARAVAAMLKVRANERERQTHSMTSHESQRIPKFLLAH